MGYFTSYSEYKFVDNIWSKKKTTKDDGDKTKSSLSVLKVLNIIKWHDTSNLSFCSGTRKPI